MICTQGTQWGFYQCEPDVWIVLAVDTQVSVISQGTGGSGSIHYYKHSPNGEGMVQALQVRCPVRSVFYMTILYCVVWCNYRT